LDRPPLAGAGFIGQAESAAGLPHPCRPVVQRMRSGNLVHEEDRQRVLTLRAQRHSYRWIVT
jgi:hypothetical protein